MSGPISQAREALAFWNNGAGHADAAWVERHAHNGYAALASLAAHAEQVERERDADVQAIAQASLHSAATVGVSLELAAETFMKLGYDGMRERVERAEAERDEWRAKAEARPQITDEMVTNAREELVRLDSVYLPRKIVRRALEAALGGES